MDENLFEEFNPSAPPPAAETGRPKRNRRQRATKPAPEPKEAKVRKPRAVRQPRAPRAVPAIKVDLGTALGLVSEMKAEDLELFGQIVAVLQKQPKKARSRIALAMGKMFG